MPSFLIDVNLPRHFPLWADSAYTHQCDLGFHDALSNIWPQVLELNQEYKLVNIFADRIEGVK